MKKFFDWINPITNPGKALNRITKIILFISIISIWSSCSDPTNIGAKVVGEIDRMEPVFTDTLTVTSITRRDDSLFTYKNNTYFLGTLNDPKIGKTFAGINVQARLPSNNINLGDGLVADSAFLELDYYKVYGDKDARHSFLVYQISDVMDFNEEYRSYHQFPYDPVVIGKIENFIPATGDSSILRIKLDKGFADMMINQSRTLNFASNFRFLEFFRGIYIAPDTSNGYSNSLMYIDLLGGKSRMVFYYKNKGRDSLTFNLSIGVSSAMQNFYKNQYTNPSLLDQLNKIVKEDSINYIKGLSGLSIAVNVPHIKNLGKISIMKAELVLTQIPDSSSSTYSLPFMINPRIRLDSVSPYFKIILDEEFSSVTPRYDVGGVLLTEKVGNQFLKRYKMNLAMITQDAILTDTIYDIPMLLKIIPSEESPERAIIGGGNHQNPNYRMKLNLIYVKL
jgi:Domain of unknown function (DUF4270)